MPAHQPQGASPRSESQTLPIFSPRAMAGGLQLVLAVCLIARFFYGGALLSSAVLLAIFFAVQTSAVARGLDISCGCFGASLSKSVGAESLGSVAVLLCIAVVSYYVQQRVALFTERERPSD
jgi:hypothetical protein